MKNILITLILVITLFFIQGCTSRPNGDNPSIDNNSGIADFITNGEYEEKNKFTLAELKDLLETSNMIEIKDLENQIIGQIAEDENIAETIENIFSYKAVNDYKDFSKEKVIATINFFPDGDQPVYGLIKEKFIYIEDYCFIAENSGVNKIINYFKNKTNMVPID